LSYLFKVDENLPLEVTQLLRSYGHEATSAEEQKLGGVKDERLATVCRQEGRVLLTLDLDFADIRSYRPEDYPGIVILRLGRQDRTAVLEATRRLIAVVAGLSPAGRLLIVEDRRVRSRGGSGSDGEEDA
jgi:predicted nuclease of predicted toxin-antitoxin system